MPTLTEAKRLLRFWDKGNSATLADSLRYHFAAHGEEVGTSDVWQYVKEAKAFSQDLRGARAVDIGNGKTWYVKSGRYVIKNPDGKILSFGRR